MNNVSIIGNICAKPELRTTQSGISVTSFSVAVKRKYGDDTDFIEVQCWRKTAEFVCKYFDKGQKIALTGSLQTDSFEVEGKKRTKTFVVADNVEFCQKKEERQDYEEVEDDDDIPF